MWLNTDPMVVLWFVVVAMVTSRLSAGQMEPPALADHERIDLALRQASVRIAQRFMDLVELAAQAIDQKVHERFGYLSPDAYFEDRVHLAPRTVYKWLRIRAAVLSLPPEDQAEAREALATVGSHKAKVLVPVLTREGEDWRAWVKKAEGMKEEALQWAVSQRTGALPRGASAAGPGQAFLRHVLNIVPPESRPFVAGVFDALMKFGELENPIAVFLLLCDLGARDLAAQGVEVVERHDL